MLQCLLRHLDSICYLFLTKILDRALSCSYYFDRLIFSLHGIPAKEISCMMHSRYIVNCVRCITHTQLRSHFDCWWRLFFRAFLFDVPPTIGEARGDTPKNTQEIDGDNSANHSEECLSDEISQTRFAHKFSKRDRDIKIERCCNFIKKTHSLISLINRWRRTHK